MGELNFRGWKVADRALQAGANGNATITAQDVSPNLQQKGVDMRIALDISSMTLKNQADIFCLVTGDSDFAPIIKFARSEGKQVYTYTLGHRVKPSIPITIR
ncbi:NYN domain-containing protein [Pantoea hericii]|uniref:NYN domain-containing protein n=1 Tax=Pantoea hericii TaxID=1815628 RepID=UPI0038F70345